MSNPQASQPHDAQPQSHAQLGLAAPGAAEQARVERLKQITPGDFAAVLRHGRLMPLTSATALVAGLETECALKHGGARHTMGFV